MTLKCVKFILVLSPCYISLDGQLSFHPENVLFTHVFMLANTILLILLLRCFLRSTASTCDVILRICKIQTSSDCFMFALQLHTGQAFMHILPGLPFNMEYFLIFIRFLPPPRNNVTMFLCQKMFLPIVHSHLTSYLVHFTTLYFQSCEHFHLDQIFQNHYKKQYMYCFLSRCGI